MKVTEKDLLNLVRIKKLLDEGTFPLQKREVQVFAETYNWLSEMSKNISLELKHQANNKVKPVAKKKTKKKVVKGGDNSRQSS